MTLLPQVATQATKQKLAVVLALAALGLLAGAVRGKIAGATQTDIIGPAGSDVFGTQVTVLPNGNFVVTDPQYDAPGPIADVGRVYLYDGDTLALINTMTGSAENDFIGADNSVRGVRVLANGDYVVISSSWNGGRGAVTRCSATTGCPATISSSNSLVGSAANNFVGGDGVTALPNGHYVVRSSGWDNGPTANVGAITWCDGAAGCTGAVSAANSRVGSTVGDQIGLINIIVLANDNYVSQDLFWSDSGATFAGAVTFCSGTGPCTGAVSVANSLVGTTPNEFTGNQGIFPLTNGNYVVANDLWDNIGATDAGAATFCSGTTGCTAAVGPANSLVGSTTGDHVALNGIAVLSNGNYVVRSGSWDNGGVADVGAATFCNGTTGCVGTTVSTSNSLHGSTFDDGAFLRATALTNGNYVVSNIRWDNAAMSEIDVGASTWCDGTTGCTGPVTPGNSLIGGRAGEAIGTNGTVALTNGNYVVLSPNWSGPVLTVSNLGAATFCEGTTGRPGEEVSPANSLVGSSTNDNVGNATPLTNGNYVVTAGSWDNGTMQNVGAATFCSGTSGCVGPVAPGNSLIGAAADNGVGGNGALALTNGNYVVLSGSWDSDTTSSVGAITPCNGTSGCSGTVSAGNSLVGSTENDFLGASAFGSVTALSNGDYIVLSAGWDNGGLVDAGAVTYGQGNGGTVGPITASNSVRCTIESGGFSLNFSFGLASGLLAVGRSEENIVTVFAQGGAAPAATSVLSRKTHGGLGPFDINLPLTGTPGVECRTGGAGGNYQVLVTFANPVTVGGISIASSNGMATGMQSASGAVVTVDLAAVASAQIVGITLTNVNAGTNAGDVLIPFRVLVGDTTGSGSVTSSDVGQTKSLSGQAVTGVNFRADVTASGGTINSSDIGLVKSTSGTQLP